MGEVLLETRGPWGRGCLCGIRCGVSNESCLEWPCVLSQNPDVAPVFRRGKGRASRELQASQPLLDGGKVLEQTLWETRGFVGGCEGDGQQPSRLYEMEIRLKHLLVSSWQAGSGGDRTAGV